MSESQHSPAEHDRLIALFGLCTTCAVGHAQEQIVAREAAIDRAAAAASPEWLRKARRAVLDVASELDEFTTDDVWLRLPTVREPRALGAVLRELAGEGLIVRTDRTRPSDQPANHRRPVRVWQPAAARLLV